MSVNTGGDGVPHRVASVVMDMSTALFTFQAVSAALYARQREPRGRYLETSLMQSGAALQILNTIGSYLEGGVVRPGLTPSGTFPAQDGWLNVTVLRNEDFGVLCDVLERSDLKADPRFADNDARYRHVGAMTEALGEAFRRRPVAEWCERLTAGGIMHARVNTHLEYLHDGHVEASGTVLWAEQPGLGKIPVPWPPGVPPPPPGTRRAAAPSLGEHGTEIRAELGLDDGGRAEAGARRATSEPKRVEQVDDVRSGRVDDADLAREIRMCREHGREAVLRGRPVLSDGDRRVLALSRLLFLLLLVPIFLALAVDLLDGIGEVHRERRAPALLQQHLQGLPLRIAMLAVAREHVVVGGDAPEEDRVHVASASVMGHLEDVHVHRAA